MFDLDHNPFGEDTFLKYKQFLHEVLLDFRVEMSQKNSQIIREALLDFGENEYDYYLKFHQKMLLNILYFNDQNLLCEYLLWRLSTFLSRDVKVEFLQIENRLFQNIALRYLRKNSAICEQITSLHDYIDSYYIHKNRAKSQAPIKLQDPQMQQLYTYALERKESAFLEICSTNIHNLREFCHFFTQSISPIFEQIGRDWQNNLISVAKEHIATALINDAVFALLEKYEPLEKKNKKILLMTTFEENHHLGTQIAEKILTLLGYDVFTVGSKQGMKSMTNAMIALEPDYVLISSVLPIYLYEIVQIIIELKSCPSHQSREYFVAGNAGAYLSNPCASLGCDSYIKNFSQLYMRFNLSQVGT